MTKQEEIREGIESLFKGSMSAIIHDFQFHELTSDWRKEFTNRVLKYLHSQGVVIKVDKELPFLWDGYTMDGYIRELIEAGYVAVEPLIKESKNDRARSRSK